MTVKHKTRWARTPRVGTKTNEIFRALLKGISSRDIDSLGINRSNLSQTIRRLSDDCGFDVRQFRGAPDGKHTGTRGSKTRPTIYKIVGRVKWNGGYVSFTEKYADEQ